MKSAPKGDRGQVIGMPVDPLNYHEACQSILSLTTHGRMVCVANVHMAMETRDDPDFKKIVIEADMVVPDGMPLVWMLRRTGWPAQTRVYGPTLMRELCSAAAHQRISIALYGGQEEDIAELLLRLPACHSGLMISFSKSPPFGISDPQKEKEDCADM